MKTAYLVLSIAVFTFLSINTVLAQNVGETSQPQSIFLDNTFNKNNSGLTIGGYGHVDYNQPIGGDVRKNGTIDVHRMVMMLGYRFDARTTFVSEIEFEHLNELSVEMAYLQYKLNNYFTFRAGQLLVPMGMMNEYHEPLLYNGVERPLVENAISPTTWSQFGVGFAGFVPNLSLKYQVYMMNGLSTYAGGEATIGGSGIRKARQEGIAYVSSPNVAVSLDYFGVKNLQIGASLFAGKTQSQLYNGLDKTDALAVSRADSSTVNMVMIGLDAQYRLKGLQLKAQFYYTSMGGTDAFNKFTAKNGVANSLGSAMMGWYAEAGYNVLSHFNTSKELIPFVRYEQYNTQYKVGNLITANDKYKTNAIFAGLGFKITRNAVVKMDFQFSKNSAESKYNNILNTGVGVMF